MKPDKSLFLLFKSLSKAEKIYLKKFAGRHSKNGSSVKLLEAIESRASKDDYDEAEVKDLLRKEIPSGEFPVIKNYLYNNLLNGLTRYYQKSNVSIGLSALINSAEVLFQKGHLEQSLKLLKRAREAAIENESYIKLLEVIRLENRSVRASAPLNAVSEKLMNNYEEERSVLDKIENRSTYRRLFDEFVIFLTGEGTSGNKEQRTALKKYLSGKFLIDESLALTTHSVILFNLIYLIYLTLFGDPKKALMHGEKILTLYKEKPGRKIIYGYEYILTLQELSSVQRNLGNDRKAKAYAGEVMRCIDTILKLYPKRVRNFLLCRTLLTETNVSLLRGDFEKSRELIEQLLENNPPNSYRDEKIVTNYAAGIIYYALGEKEKALDHINKILNSPEINIRTDLQASARIINLIIHYELGNLDSIKYFLRSVYHYLKKRRKLSNSEITILEFIKSMVKARTSDEQIYILKKANDDIAVIRSGPPGNRSVNLFFIETWVEGKLSGRSFAEVIKQRASGGYYS